MAMSRSIAGLVLLAGVAAAKHEPFADVAELAPHRFEDHCGPTDKKTGLAKCARSISKTLDDDGEIHFSYAVEIKPNTILSLDTEADHGVKLTYCDENSIELELPEAYARYATEGTTVVASKFVHTCKHLGINKHMLRRVVGVKQLTKSDGPSPVTKARLSTKSHRSFAEAIPSVSMNFSYMPAEAREKNNPFPTMKTKKHRSSKQRRLQQFHQAVYDGNPQQSANSDFGIDSQNQLVKFEPNQISNFGWNWNFFLNSTEEPEFNYSLPGMEGYVKLKQPYIKIHAGIYFNFTSKFGQMLEMEAPAVNWKAGIVSHGQVNARMMTDMKTIKDASEDPFALFNIPALEKLKETQWLEEIDVAMGPMPMTVEPGFQFKAELYHVGQFDGTLQLGGKTDFAALPEISFDSDKGIFANLKADFQDTTLYPPLWIIATEHFEMGLMLEPCMWVQGNFGGENDEVKIGFEARPYFNTTIYREGSGESGTASIVGEETKALIAYPYRVIGLPSTDFTKKYSVKIQANNLAMESTPALNWGQVQITDHMSEFNAGEMAQKAVLTNPITVTLIETDVASGTQTPVGQTTVTCGSLLNGECQPNPTIASLTVDGIEVRVELVILWMDNPVPWFASHIRGVALSFPSIVLNTQALASAIPELAEGTAPTQKMFLRATHAGETYVTEVTGLDSYSTSSGGTLTGASVIEFGPTFLESWIPAGEGDWESSKIQLYYGSTLIGQNNLPEIPFSSSLPDLVSSDASVTNDDSPMMQMMAAASGGGGDMLTHMMTKGLAGMATVGEESTVPANIPLSISLFDASGSGDPDSNGIDNIAVVHATATVVAPAVASVFLQPSKSSVVVIGSEENFIWTVAYVQEGEEYDFRLSTWKAVPTSDSDAAASASYPSVGDKTLQPVPGSEQEMKAHCDQIPINGMDSEELPCSFVHQFAFVAGTYAVGDGIVLMVEWIDGGKDHVMFSTPFEIVSETTARRLQSQKKERRLWTEEDWNTRLAANQNSCNKKDLHFEVGFGMMVRGKMADPGMPMMPMFMPMAMGMAGGGMGMGGLGSGGMGMTTSDGEQMISTGFENLGQTDLVNSDSEDLLPSWLCADGVCEGKMPGCTQADFKTMYFPTLVFHFNRNLEFKDLEDAGIPDTDMVKTAFAYAFSTLPELIEVLLEEINTTDAPTPAPMAMTGAAVTGSQLQWPVAATAAVAPVAGLPTVDAGVAATTAAPALWGAAGGRRLRSTGRPARRHHHMSNRVTMHFKKGVHYIVDRPLVEMMIKHHMFQDIEDAATKRGERGSFIQRFEVYSDQEGKVCAKDDSENAATLERPWSWQYSRRQPARFGFAAATLGGLVACAALASVVLYRSKRSQYGILEGNENLQEQQEQQEGLE